MKARFPIAYKFIIGIMLITISISLFLYLYFPAKIKETMLEKEMINAQVLIDVISVGAGIALSNEDFSVLSITMNTAKKFPNADYIIFLDNSDKEFAAYNPKSKEVDSSKYFMNTEKEFHPDHLLIKSSVIYDNQKYGSILLNYSLSNLNGQIDQYKFVITIISIAILLFGIIMAIFWAGLVTSPVKRLMFASEKVSEGDLDVNVYIDSKDEFGVMAHTFNLMVKNIKSKSTELTTKNVELKAQQEELEQNNVMLEEKTQLLEKSEIELKAQQEELQASNEELEEKAILLEEQKEKLELAKMEVETKAGQLETTSKYKSEFLANMSHELRTPLNSILILAQLLTENKQGTLGEKEIEFAANIHSSGTDLLSLINEILDLSKIEAGKMEMDIEPIDVKKIVKNMGSTFNELARTKSIEFIVNYVERKDISNIHTDDQRLEQILRNLLSNAFKFTEKKGTVKLDIHVLAPPKGLKNPKLRSESEIMAFAVSDSGTGIPKDKHKIIFEAFQQADGSTRRKYGGTGLGLSICRELANALGGEIHLESTEGMGSTFTLFLPLKVEESGITTNENVTQSGESVSREEQLQQVDHKSTVGINEFDERDINDDRFIIEKNDKVILIIEDDNIFANVLLDFIRERGFKGIKTTQGNIGLSLARQYNPDAILLDLKMPVMDGSEVLKYLKSDPELRHIPVQIISGYDHKKEVLDLGAFGFIQKPLQENDLKNTFDRIEEFVSKKLKKLLIIEDDVKQNTLIKTLIGNGDVMSFSAYTGVEALNMLQQEQFDCIIIDLGLPDMSGFDLLETIKEDKEINHTPVIVYTGKDLTRDESSRLNKLANTVVLKTAESHERLLDETILFLHRVESRLPKEKQKLIRKLHRSDEVLNNKTVLIVDDDMRNIYSLTNALEDEGVKCLTAENGRACLEVLKEHSDVDIILMDIMMPEMDGYETTRRIKEDQLLKKIPIIALTAKAMKGDREKCLQVGMSDYVSKPVDLTKLLSLMRVWLYQ